MIAELPAEIDRYLQREGFDHRRIHQYQSDMHTLLLEKLQEESQFLRERWCDVAVDLVQSLTGTYKSLHRCGID